MVRPFYKGFVDFKLIDKHEDPEYLSTLQSEAIKRYSLQVLLEQELYLMDHPEIILMLSTAVANLDDDVQTHLSQLANFFQRPKEELHDQLKMVFGESFIAEKEARVKANKERNRLKIKYDRVDLQKELERIMLRYAPSATDRSYSTSSSSITTSSSFLTFDTGQTTPKTPEPEPEPVITISQIFYTMVVATVTKATMLKVTEDQIKYDVAYVTLMNIVEDVMEMAVETIKEDIRDLYVEAYEEFERIIKQKQDEADAIAWENRMRKKLKRLLRRQKNFRGYETPPSSRSHLSEHPSYKLSPQQICVCHPKWKYNRYPKDRFGIYLPPEIKYAPESVTITPDITEEAPQEEKVEQTQ